MDNDFHLELCLTIDTASRINNYEELYPPDEYGQEMGPNARVWRVYLDEADLFDKDLLDGYRDSLDVLLVFVSFKSVFTEYYA